MILPTLALFSSLVAFMKQQVAKKSLISCYFFLKFLSFHSLFPLIHCIAILRESNDKQHHRKEHHEKDIKETKLLDKKEKND